MEPMDEIDFTLPWDFQPLYPETRDLLERVFRLIASEYELRAELMAREAE